MRILVTGANGNISWWFVQLALNHGNEVYAIGRSFDKLTRKTLPEGTKKINCDLRNITDMKSALKNMYFDVVCDFICYNKEHALEAIELYTNMTNHYIFISSEAIYKRETRYLPFKENTPYVDLKNSGSYIKGKIEAEIEFKKAYELSKFPVTILRPSFTYDTLMPTSIGLNCYTAVNRYKQDKTALIAGDGNNLWTFTHSKDFSNAIMGIINEKDSIGQDYHITTDEWLTWIDATNIIIKELNLKDTKILHIPKEVIFNTVLLGEKDLLNQRMSHNIFDNTKIKNLLPNWNANINFEEGVKETLLWLNKQQERQRINPLLDTLLIEFYKEGKEYVYK